MAWFKHKKTGLVNEASGSWEDLARKSVDLEEIDAPEEAENLDTGNDEKTGLVNEAIDLKIGSKSVLDRWSVDRLKTAIAEAKVPKE